MRGMTILAIAALCLSTASCARGVSRGAVAMKMSDREAHVSLGKDEVAVGERVTLFRSACQRRPGPTKGTRVECEKTWVGEGRIVKILSEDYSAIEVDPGVSFAEGDLVEAARR